MKTTLLNLAVATVLCAALFIACKKKSPDPEPDPVSGTTTSGSTTGNPVTASGFTWTAAGTQSIADSAYYIEGGWGSGIRAYKAGNLRFEINFTSTSLAAGTYTLGSGHGLTYIDNGTYFDDASSQFQVSALANNKASGNYSGTAMNASTSASVALTINFSGIPKK